MRPQTPARAGSRVRRLAVPVLVVACGAAALAYAAPGNVRAASAGAGSDIGAAAAVPEQLPDPTSSSAPTGLPTPVISVSAPSTVVTGETATVSASITKAATTGEIVLLERLDQDPPVAIDSARVDGDGRVKLSLTENAAATYTYRLRLSATTLHKAASSAAFTIDVRPEPPAQTTAPPVNSSGPSPSATDSPSATASSPEPPSPLCGGTTPLRDDGRRWVCTYDDEFDGTSLDRRYWVPQVSANSNFYSGTSAQAACFTDDPQTIAVRDGNLALSARLLDDPVPCGTSSTRMVSGMVSHQDTFNQAYGRYEVRAQVPAWSDKGLQETFWLWPVDLLKYGLYHPASGEIDFAEFYSNYAYLNIPVIHYVLDPSTISYATNTNIYTAQNCFIPVGQFNTYVLEWYPGQMRISINDKLCLVDNYVASNAPEGHPNAPFDSPFFLALTQAFGTTGNEYDPATGPTESSTLVDYVRIWS